MASEMEERLVAVFAAIERTPIRRAEKEFLRKQAVIAAVAGRQIGGDIVVASGATANANGGTLCASRDVLLASASKLCGRKLGVVDLQVLVKDWPP